jgi:hypothetical protein
VGYRFVPPRQDEGLDVATAATLREPVR